MALEQSPGQSSRGFAFVGRLSRPVANRGDPAHAAEAEIGEAACPSAYTVPQIWQRPPRWVAQAPDSLGAGEATRTSDLLIAKDTADH